MDMDLAFQNRDVLRALREKGLTASITNLAEATGRDVSNLSKTLKRLETEGFVTRSPHLQLAPAADPVLRAADAAEGKLAGAAPEGFVGLLHGQITPDALNPRKDFDAAEEEDDPGISDLAGDILQNGLMQNLLVRPDLREETVAITGPDGAALPMFRLVAGERRWRAIDALIHDGDWPADRLVPCQVIDTDDRGHRLRALAENLQRCRLNPIEEAKAFHELRELDGLSTQDIADELSITQRQVQMRLQLLELPTKDQARMELPKDDPKHLSVREARAIVQRPKEVPPSVSPAELLIMAEVYDRCVRQPKSSGYQQTECAPDFTDPILERLVNCYWISRTARSYDDGRAYISIGYQGRGALEQMAPDLQGDDRTAALLRIRAAVVGDKEAVKVTKADRYVTAWLNGPWDITEEAKAELEERQRLDAERQAEQAANARFWADAAAKTEAFGATLREIEQPTPLHPEFKAAIEHIRGPLPYTVDEQGWIKDANGKAVDGLCANGGWLGANDINRHFRWLMVAAINAAAGLQTPAHAAPDPERDDLSREAFEAALATALRSSRPDMDEAAAAAKATEILADFLTDNSVEFGDPDSAWDANVAREMVDVYDDGDESEAA